MSAVSSPSGGLKPSSVICYVYIFFCHYIFVNLTWDQCFCVFDWRIILNLGTHGDITVSAE